jgi:hypothetical protein
MRNLLTLVFAVVLGVACFVPAPASAYYYRGRYYRYNYRGHYYRYHYHGTTIGTGPGLSASMGVQGIIGIGKRIIVRTALTIL